MWSEACEMLARADRMHRQLFQPSRSPLRQPTWEPPVDILETDDEVLVLVALPGVNLDRVDAAIEGGDLLIAGTRILPAALRTALIHRLELPQGLFERRVPLPTGRYGRVRRTAADGCLLVTLEKVGTRRG
jgi:HSP20 family molecular chaperone IbpA